MTIGEAAVSVLRGQYRAWRRQEPAVRKGSDADAIHDMRVAIRRIRSALELFDEILPEGWTDLRARLKWLAGLLGDVRDLDVEIEVLVSWSKELDPVDRPFVSPLVDRLRRRRRSRSEKLVGELGGERYRRLVSDTERLLSLGRGPAEGEAPVLKAAPLLLVRRHRKLAGKAKRAKPSSPSEDLHALRIACKRLRYAVEFFTPLYGRPAKEVVSACKAVQDVLGEHQDAVVASARLRELPRHGGRGLPPETLFLLGRLFERYQRTMEACRKRFQKPVALVLGKRWKRLSQGRGMPHAQARSFARVRRKTTRNEREPRGP